MYSQYTVPMPFNEPFFYTEQLFSFVTRLARVQCEYIDEYDEDRRSPRPIRVAIASVRLCQCGDARSE